MSRHLRIVKSKGSPPCQGGARGGLAIIVSLFLLLSTPFLQAIPVRSGNDGPGEPGGDNQPITAVTVALANPSFEQGNDDEELPAPANWTPFTLFVGENHLWESEFGSAGSRSIAIYGTRWEYGRWTSNAIAVEDEGFQWYTLTGKVRAIANDGEVYLAIAWYNADGDRINTSDSPMLDTSDTDWISMSVNAMPPAGATLLEVWCISNHNAGQTWFDEIALTRTAFTTENTVSYAQFLIDYPAELLAIEANVMQVRELMTQAKWAREADFYGTDAQLRSSELYGQASKIPRVDTVITSVFTALHEDLEKRAKAVEAAKARFDGLINEALFAALGMAEAGNDTEKADGYRTKLTERGVLDTADPIAD